VNQEQSRSAQVHFDKVSVLYYSKPKWLGGKPHIALDNLSLNIETKNVAIVGPSGAGKSTLIELLFGLRQPSNGEVYVCGQPLSRINHHQHQALCRHIQLIPQEPQSSLNPYYTVRQVLLEPLTNMGANQDLEAKVHQVLADVRLDSTLLERNSQQLSVGQAQRVAIARALISEPCVLVADEPTSSLDPVSRAQVIDLLKEIQSRRQMKLILVTHDLDAAQVLCNEIVVLDKGKMVEKIDSCVLSNQAQHHTTQALLGAQYHNTSELNQNVGDISYAT